MLREKKGEFIAYRGYFAQFKDGYHDMIDVYITMRNTIGCSWKYFELLEREPEIPLDDSGIIVMAYNSYGLYSYGPRSRSTTQA